jgi:hypothetical protein
MPADTLSVAEMHLSIVYRSTGCIIWLEGNYLHRLSNRSELHCIAWRMTCSSFWVMNQSTTIIEEKYENSFVIAEE